MTSTFVIMLSGLMALVPDTPVSLSPMSAYLVNAKGHERKLSVFGDVSLAGDGTICRVVAKRFIECDFGDARAEIDLSELKASGPSSLPPPPGSNEKGKNDDSAGWFVRMSSVYLDKPKAAMAKPRGINDGLKPPVPVILRKFSWTHARSLQLDGSEMGYSARIGFKSDKHPAYVYSQAAVAEGMLFYAVTDGRPWHIKIGKQVIAVGSNASMVLTNNSNQTSCSKYDDGNHFLLYYDLLVSPLEKDDKRLPHRLTPGDMRCVKPKDVRVSPRVKEGILEILAPLKVGAINSGPTDASGTSWPAFKIFIENAFGKEVAASVGGGRHSAAGALFANDINQLYVTDRIICPPVLLDSPPATATSTSKQGSGE